MDDIKPDLLDQVQGPLELLFRLPRKADDDVCRDTARWNALPDPCDDPPVHVNSVATPHRLEDGIIACLHRNIDVLAHLGETGDGIENAVGEVSWVGGEEANTYEPVDLAECFEEIGEIAPLRAQVPPIAIHNLAKERHLAGPFSDQAPRLGDQLRNGPADFPPAPERHDAVRTPPVASRHHRKPARNWERTVRAYDRPTGGSDCRGQAPVRGRGVDRWVSLRHALVNQVQERLGL